MGNHPCLVLVEWELLLIPLGWPMTEQTGSCLFSGWWRAYYSWRQGGWAHVGQVCGCSCLSSWVGETLPACFCSCHLERPADQASCGGSHIHFQHWCLRQWWGQHPWGHLCYLHWGVCVSLRETCCFSVDHGAPVATGCGFLGNHQDGCKWDCSGC